MFVAWVHGRIEDPPLAFDLIGTGRARQFRIAHKPGRAVPRHVELRIHANATLARILDQVANLILRIKKPVRTHFVQLGKLFTLHPETLVFREMPVENVHFYRFHSVQVALNDIQRNEVASGIDHQSAPGKSRRVMNRDHRHREAVGRRFHQLQKSLQAVHSSQRSSGRKPDAGGCYLQNV